MAQQQNGAIDKDEDALLVFETSENVKVVNSFEAMGLKEELLQGIYAYSKSHQHNQHTYKLYHLYKTNARV